MRKWYVLYQNPETARPSGREIDLADQRFGDWTLEQARRRLFDLLGREVPDRGVLEAMERVPRDLFVSPEMRHMAYADSALPIGEGQTISQPLIVAMMTAALELTGDETVLEIGTGSGYQAAVLAQLARRVVSVERKGNLLVAARRRLGLLGIGNVELHLAGQRLGWPRAAPYQAIMVTAGAPRIPESLVDQLADGGRLVIPAGPREQQELLKATKRSGRLKVVSLGGCGFVPLIGDDAWRDER